jgi:hypothetical protein
VPVALAVANEAEAGGSRNFRTAFLANKINGFNFSACNLLPRRNFSFELPALKLNWCR